MKLKLLASSAIAGIALLIGCSSSNSKSGQFAVANFDVGGDVVIFNSKSQSIEKKIDLNSTARPSYVIFSTKNNKLYVSDHGNKQIVALNGDNFNIESQFALNQGGAFHNWFNDTVNQLWVASNTDLNASVLDATTGTIMTLDVNAGVNSFDSNITVGGVTHDLIISNDGKYAFVGVNVNASSSLIVKYDTTSKNVVDVKTDVGGDPHFIVKDNDLYILGAAEGTITKYKENNLSNPIRTSYISGVHGVTFDKFKNRIFVTDLGNRTVYSLDSDNLDILDHITLSGDAGAAHNLAYDSSNSVLSVTYTNGTQVEFFSVLNDGTLTSIGVQSADSSPATGQTGPSGPFGITFLNR